jgi:hypothetical protein
MKVNGDSILRYDTWSLAKTGVRQDHGEGKDSHLQVFDWRLPGGGCAGKDEVYQLTGGNQALDFRQGRQELSLEMPKQAPDLNAR